MKKNARLLKIFGKKVRRYRHKKSLTQKDVAFKAGISRAYMGYIEQGRNVPSLKVLQKIAKTIGAKLNKNFVYGTLCS